MQSFGPVFQEPREYLIHGQGKHGFSDTCIPEEGSQESDKPCHNVPARRGGKAGRLQPQLNNGQSNPNCTTTQRFSPSP